MAEDGDEDCGTARAIVRLYAECEAGDEGVHAEEQRQHQREGVCGGAHGCVLVQHAQVNVVV